VIFGDTRLDALVRIWLLKRKGEGAMWKTRFSFWVNNLLHGARSQWKWTISDLHGRFPIFMDDLQAEDFCFAKLILVLFVCASSSRKQAEVIRV